MFLKSLSRMRRSVSFRIAVWYSIIFPLSSLLVIGIFYFLLSSYVNHKDRQILHAKLDEYISRYKEGGIPALNRAIRKDRENDKRVSFFVRIAAKNNSTIFLSVPKAETVRDYKYLEHPGFRPRLVGAHGGNIEVESAPEEGARFTVRLPATGHFPAESLIANISAK
ncbi:MAG: hypothetical protein P4L55_06705 [Syntrophobacteraceae bacterium]|nr:hypothetical protein [Syntrophobacteraceae bacterium]